MILVVGGLAAIAAIAIASFSATASNVRSHGMSLPVFHPESSQSPRTATTNNPASVAVCRTDFQAASTAVSEYEALNGRPPIAITSIADMLKDPLGNPNFTIEVDPAGTGTVEVATPGHPSSPGDVNCDYAGPPPR